jgi:hypothetical protein
MTGAITATLLNSYINMSASTKARFALKMSHGSYHSNLFREERNTHETIVVRNGITTSSAAAKAGLGTNLGALLASAMKPTKTR